MSHFTRKQRLIIALGGFLFFVGFMVLAMVILAAMDIIDIANLLQFGFLKEILIVIGVLDVVAGILLLRFTSY
ncbi:MAG: hypothetical protein OEY95_03195 [Candidatus Bathyarchaeota archaeon]|nr:hypothetical protein [Candidatus Bathyarchaeota archaeon]MDH5754197.1 hypothetical protein [Candidatus Bathyarchaeota archaeon]MDI6904493.1 hypothetical protein [Candidatus Bathyarchaeia archaeon]